MASLRDVARQAGVSVATASRVASGLEAQHCAALHPVETMSLDEAGTSRLPAVADYAAALRSE